MTRRVPCIVCGEEAHLICSKCQRVRYCDPECQKRDWKEHKSSFCIGFLGKETEDVVLLSTFDDWQKTSQVCDSAQLSMYRQLLYDMPFHLHANLTPDNWKKKITEKHIEMAHSLAVDVGIVEYYRILRDTAANGRPGLPPDQEAQECFDHLFKYFTCAAAGRSCLQENGNSLLLWMDHPDAIDICKESAEAYNRNFGHLTVGSKRKTPRKTLMPLWYTANNQNLVRCEMIEKLD